MDDEHEFTKPTVEQVAGPGTDMEIAQDGDDLPGIATPPQDQPDDPSSDDENGDDGPEPDDDPATAGEA